MVGWEILGKILAIHESNLYARIQSRLGANRNLKSFDITGRVVKREKLRDDFQISITNQESSDKVNRKYQALNTFLDSLKKERPKYSRLKCASVEQPLGIFLIKSQKDRPLFELVTTVSLSLNYYNLSYPNHNQ